MNKSIIPNLFTSANLAFGVLGITLSATNNTFCSYMYIIVSSSRWVRWACSKSFRVAGPMGRELDSLSDVVGFGVAPAYMLYMKELNGLDGLHMCHY